jgi:GGDEF domain-containing protein
MTSVDMGWLEIERARYEMLLDPLTGLPRWGLLLDRTAVALARARRSGSTVAIFVIEDPQFPNRPYDVLAVTAAIQGRLRPDDTLARIGDRRFAVLCNDIRADEDAAMVAHRLILGTGIVCGLGVALAGEQDPPDLVIARALSAAAGLPDPA